MFDKIGRYGLIAGLIAGTPLFVLMVALKGSPPLEYGLLLGYATMLLALSTVFAAIKRHRDVDLGGVIGFWPALAIGLGISTIAGIIYALAWELSLLVTQIDFAADYAKIVIDHQRAKGASDEALAALTAQMDEFKRQYASLFYRFPMTFTEIFPVGVLVSLISAGLLRNRNFLPRRRAQ